MCRICFTTDITDDAPTAPASLTNFVHCDAKAVTRRHPAADDGRAIGANDHTVIWPAGRCEVEGAGAYVGFQLRRTTDMRKTERFRVHGAPPNENGQATSSPAVSIESGVNVDHQALPQ